MRSAPTVLLVEPDSAVRDTLRAVLEEVGYTVVGYANGEKALADLRDTCVASLLVTEVRLPNLNGWQLARDARRLCPGLPFYSYLPRIGTDPWEGDEASGSRSPLAHEPSSLRSISWHLPL